MALYQRSGEKRRLEDTQRHDSDAIGTLCRLSNRPVSPKSQMEQEKRIRREIANSNERRRMQSINAGFQSLRTLLPHHEGEKLSKAAILQQTAEYIYQLEQEKTRLLSQNCQLKRLVNQYQQQHAGQEVTETITTAIATPAEETTPVSPTKKLKTDAVVGVVVSSESSDEGIGSMSPEHLEDQQQPEDIKKEMIELRVQLDRERGFRMLLEDQVRALESQLYPEKIREITQQVQMQYDNRTGESPVLQKLLADKRRDDQPTTVAAGETVIGTVIDRKSTPPPTVITADAIQDRIPTVLEAAIKAEPKVEVELAPRVPSPAAHISTVTTAAAEERPACSCRSFAGDCSSCSRTSRQNLDTIVEAIRHLEGDHLFQDDDPANPNTQPAAIVTISDAPPQDVPLELTTHSVNLEYRPLVTQQRPGVIVVKHT